MGRDGRGVKAASESSIEITFQYKRRRCCERIPLKPTPANLQRAEQHRAAILHAISTGVFDYAATFPNSACAGTYANTPGQILSVEKYLDGWLDARKPTLKSSTYQGSIVLGLLIPKFGKEMLGDLKWPAIKSWLAGLGGDKPVSNKRLSNVQSCLRSALNDAVEDELLDENCMRGRHYSRQAQPVEEGDDDEVDPFTPDEQAAILSNLPEQTRNYALFALWTGLRPSEQIALNWSDVDFARGVVLVRKAITRAAKGVAELPKTKSSRREVKILAPALAAINGQKAHTWVGAEPHGELFRNPGTGERWSSSQAVQKVWATALKRAKVRYRRPYQMRHTFASMMLSAGEHPMWVAQQMGHKDWAMIIRVYGKWMPSADLNAGGKAVDLFAEKLALSSHSGAKTAPKQPKTMTG
ncbi:site-specific integrase [Achromobacter xylosoxidans]|uniref:site-specific integrase n=1 Tax=Alcaligenes xylosoxydans xylosoxydans TaxID=85698 RepID=UPI001F147CD7|nr:site-specific integrase [Achromobacter xylosoxidans]